MAIRVLIAEPDDALRDVYERYLSSQGFMVETARTLRECLEKIAALAPDVILSELDFSDGSADEISRSTYGYAAVTVPVVVLTRRRREASLNADWPVQEYLEKPAPMYRVVEALSNGTTNPAVAIA